MDRNSKTVEAAAHELQVNIMDISERWAHKYSNHMDYNCILDAILNAHVGCLCSLLSKLEQDATVQEIDSTMLNLFKSITSNVDTYRRGEARTEPTRA